MCMSGLNSYVPCLRPHIHRRDRKLFFMISNRPLLELSAEGVLLYDSIDGRITVSELEDIYPGAADQLVAWQRAELLELVPPITPPPHPHLVVIEPHMDDAALSVAGRLLHRRGRCRITILSVVKWSIFTSYLTSGRDYLNLQEITEIRGKESVLAARLLGAEHRCLDWQDAPLRFWPAERWSSATATRFSREPQLFANMFPDAKNVARLARQLIECMAELVPDELWIPMGLGNHTDHRTTRTACLRMLSEASGRFAGIPVSLYEDIPYAGTRGHADQIRAALARTGTRLVRATEDISDVFEEKVRVVSVYASQFKTSYIEPGIRRLAEAEGGGAGKLAETYHQLEGEVHVPDEVHLSRECGGLLRLQRKIGRLLKGRMNPQRVIAIALPSGSLGGWKKAANSLATAFPNADFVAYAPDEMAWQVEQRCNGQWRLELVRGGWKSWSKVLLREFFRFGTSTLVFWRGAYGAVPMAFSKKFINLLIGILLPFRRVLFARTLSDFALMVEEQLEDDRRSIASTEFRQQVA